MPRGSRSKLIVSRWIIEISKRWMQENKGKEIYFCCWQMHPHHPLRSPFFLLRELFATFTKTAKFSTEQLFLLLLFFPTFPSFFLILFSLFSPQRAHRHFDTEKFLLAETFSPSEAKLRLTSWHCTSSPWKHTQFAWKSTRVAKVVQLGNLFSFTFLFCVHTPSLFSFFFLQLLTGASRYRKKVPFTASPTMQMCVVL